MLLLGSAILFFAAFIRQPLLAPVGAAFILLAIGASNKFRHKQNIEKIREARRRNPELHEGRRSNYLL